MNPSAGPVARIRCPHCGRTFVRPGMPRGSVLFTDRQNRLIRTMLATKPQSLLALASALRVKPSTASNLLNRVLARYDELDIPIQFPVPWLRPSSGARGRASDGD